MPVYQLMKQCTYLNAILIGLIIHGDELFDGADKTVNIADNCILRSTLPAYSLLSDYS